METHTYIHSLLGDAGQVKKATYEADVDLHLRITLTNTYCFIKNNITKNVTKNI